jgi:HEAT repeat protein
VYDPIRSSLPIACLLTVIHLGLAVPSWADDPTPPEPAGEPAAEPTGEPQEEPPAEESGGGASGMDEAGNASESGESDSSGGTPGGEPPVLSDAAEAATAQQAHALDMALHYLLIGNPTMATTAFQELFDSGITDEQLVRLVDERGIAEKVERSIGRGRGMDETSAIVMEFETRLRNGARATSRNALRIEESVAALTGSMRQQMMARSRLATAGPFAVPALLKALSDGSDARKSNAARAVLVDLKRLAVDPLCAALPSVDPSTQRKICEILGEIGYPGAQPFLLDIAGKADTAADVRGAALRAYSKLGGTSQDAASQYTALARRYFDQVPALIPYPSDSGNVIWAFDSSLGLVGTSVPTPVYCETMAVLLARSALSIDPNSQMALAVFIAADLRRAALMRLMNMEDSGESDPMRAALLQPRFAPELLATAAGSMAAQMALGMALDASDVLLIRECLRVISFNSGASSLVSPAKGRAPVVECLAYADRRVRFDAALLLARSLPQVQFPQDSAVVPTLTSMMNSTGMMGAVIATTEEDRQSLAARLGEVGLSNTVTGSSIGEIEARLSQGQSIDVLVVQGASAAVQDIVRLARIARPTATAPVVVIADGQDATALSQQYESDPRVAVFLAAATNDKFGRAIESAAGAAGGLALSTEETQRYGAQALDALRLIAESSSPVFDIRDAEHALAQGLTPSESGSDVGGIAAVLALIPTESAQRALADGALSLPGETQALLLDALAASARKYGNQLSQSQIAALKALLRSEDSAVASSAAHAFGALGLPPSDVVQLIVEPRG